MSRFATEFRAGNGVGIDDWLAELVANEPQVTRGDLVGLFAWPNAVARRAMRRAVTAGKAVEVATDLRGWPMTIAGSAAVEPVEAAKAVEAVDACPF